MVDTSLFFKFLNQKENRPLVRGINNIKVGSIIEYNKQIYLVIKAHDPDFEAEEDDEEPWPVNDLLLYPFRFSFAVRKSAGKQFSRLSSGDIGNTWSISRDGNIDPSLLPKGQEIKKSDVVEIKVVTDEYVRFYVYDRQGIKTISFMPNYQDIKDRIPVLGHSLDNTEIPEL